VEHIFGIIGGALGLVGGLVLGIDLWKSKTHEESDAEFKKLLDQIDLGAQQIAIGLASNVSNLNQFLTKYFDLLELDLPRTPDAGVRTLIIANFRKTIEQYVNSDQVSKAQALTKVARSELERRFLVEVARSQRMRWVALFGVILVAVGALGQVIDLVVGP